MRRPSAMSRSLRVAVWFAALATMLLCSLALVSPSSFLLVADGAATPISVAGSVNIIFFNLFQQALLAYQLQEPSFTGVTLSVNSGLANGLAAATSGQWDFVVTSSSVPDAMRATSPTMESYPIAVGGVAPFYNLPTDVVGTATLTLTNLAICRMWRGDITHW